MQGNWQREVRFGERGLVPAVIQDWESREVLMVGYMNEEALDLTIRTGRVHFFSRSRGRIWCKGESSGHTQEVVEIRLDCDGDAVLVKVKQKVAACHSGHFSCFYRRLTEGGWKETDEKVFDPEQVYGRTPGS